MPDKKNNILPFKLPLIFRLIQRFFPVLERYTAPLANKLTVFIFFYPMRFKIPKKEAEVLETAIISQVKVSGKVVKVYTWGEGPSVLMTHGWSGRGTQFREFIKPFNEAGFRVVSFDGPAHGMSQGRKTDVLEFGEVIGLIQAKYGPFAGAIGHSFGGVANLYALSEGIKFPKIVMIASPTITDDIVAESLKKVNASHERGEYLKKYIFKTFGSHFEEVGAMKLIEKASNTPLLLIHDTADKEVSIKHPEALKKKYPYATLIKTQGLGHLRILKSPEVVQHCLDFLRG